MKCIQAEGRRRPSQPADLFIHEAGHAVIAWELGIEITQLHFCSRTWSGRMHFIGGMYSFEGNPAGERAREAAEKDLLIYHAGLVAQRLFHYESAQQHSATDLLGLMDTAQMIESDVELIDAWSDYVEERVRAMLFQPATWHRVIALGPEIARRLYLRGDDIAAFLERIDVTQPVSPRERRWNRTEYAFGRDVDALSLSNRTRAWLDRSGIDTIAELLTYSAWDLRRAVRHAGPKAVGEVEAALAELGLTLADERRMDRQRRVDLARKSGTVSRTTGPIR